MSCFFCLCQSDQQQFHEHSVSILGECWKLVFLLLPHFLRPFHFHKFMFVHKVGVFEICMFLFSFYHDLSYSRRCKYLSVDPLNRTQPAIALLQMSSFGSRWASVTGVDECLFGDCFTRRRRGVLKAITSTQQGFPHLKIVSPRRPFRTISGCYCVS